MGNTALAAKSDSPLPKRRPGQRGKALTGPEVGDILRWHKEGLTQEQIASRFDPPKAQSTICECLARYGTDRTEDAKAILRSSAPSMALNIVKRGLPRDHVAALKGLDVLNEDTSKGGVTVIVGGDARVQVNIGQALSPLDSLVLERKPTDSGLIQAGSDKASSVNQG